MSTHNATRVCVACLAFFSAWLTHRPLLASYAQSHISRFVLLSDRRIVIDELNAAKGQHTFNGFRARSRGYHVFDPFCVSRGDFHRRYSKAQFVDSEMIDNEVHVSKLMKDADMVYFLGELQNTPLGARYRKAWDSKIELSRTIQKLCRCALSTSQALQLADVRLRYLRACDQASEALGQLTEIYGWPADSKFDRTFKYQPPARG